MLPWECSLTTILEVRVLNHNHVDGIVEEKPLNEHRRFLKNTAYMRYKVGGFLPDKFELWEGQKLFDIKPLTQNGKATIIFVMSEHCDACSFDVVKEFSDKYNKFNYLALVDGSEEYVNEVRATHQLQFRLETCEMDTLNRQLQFELIPFFLGSNKVGQVVAGGNFFNEISYLESGLAPLLDVYYHQGT